jgi:hypothetical protein
MRNRISKIILLACLAFILLCVSRANSESSTVSGSGQSPIMSTAQPGSASNMTPSSVEQDSMRANADSVVYTSNRNLDDLILAAKSLFSLSEGVIKFLLTGFVIAVLWGIYFVLWGLIVTGWPLRVAAELRKRVRRSIKRREIEAVLDKEVMDTYDKDIRRGRQRGQIEHRGTIPLDFYPKHRELAELFQQVFLGEIDSRSGYERFNALMCYFRTIISSRLPDDSITQFPQSTLRHSPELATLSSPPPPAQATLLSIDEYNHLLATPARQAEWLARRDYIKVTFPDRNHSSSAASPRSDKIEFTRDDNGMFRIIDEDNRYLLFPVFTVKREQCSTLEDCFEVHGHDAERGRQRERVKKLIKPGICVPHGEGWRLEQRGEVVVEPCH